MPGASCGHLWGKQEGIGQFGGERKAQAASIWVFGKKAASGKSHGEAGEMGEGAGGRKEYRQIAATMKVSSGGAMPNPMSLLQSVGVNVNGQQQHRKTNAGRSGRRRRCGEGEWEL